MEGKEKERERNIDVREKHPLVAFCMPPTGDLAHNPGLGTNWGLNRYPLWDDALTTEPHQPGLKNF